ncbi:glycerophosphodiester phosphodiesterase [Amycolatopsis minnesotensis]|uniref:Glycerophosphodiester phosphodiesterase family protein n=1 Tax=Amycolatopsis minnesotensis TaxID=337894 RepID=A0ABN2RDY1_9PSEU
MRPAISAHRGGSEEYPPATAEAYQSSVETGAEYVELDIRRTADGRLVVYHDDFGDLTYAGLCERVGYEPPLLREVFGLLAGHAIAHLDLKEIGDEHEIVELAKELLGDRFVVTSLEDVSIARVSRDFPEVRTALSLGRNLDGSPWWHRARVRLTELFPARRLKACGAGGVAVHQRIARAGVLAQCARAGRFAMVWTVDDDESLRRFLADARVDVLITNRPRHAVELRGEHP